MLPISHPPVENGAIAVADGKILLVGKALDVQKEFGSGDVPIIDHEDSALLPAFVNCHVHTELSALKGVLSKPQSFVDWVSRLVAIRGKFTDEQHRKAIVHCLDEMHAEGIAAFADVMNTALTPQILQEKNPWGFQGIFFREIIDPQGNWQMPDKRNDPVEVLQTKGFEAAYSAHALYSVAPETLRAVKAWCRQKNLPFSIHLSETKEESEYITKGTGELADFIASKAKEAGREALPVKTSNSPVKFADALGILDAHTLCIHCVHVSQSDMELIVRRGANVCLCLKSNQFLGAGTAQVEAMMKCGIRLCIGTDSLASNDRLSMLAEIAAIKEQHPAVSGNDILRMATLNGALSLGLSGLGSLEQGKDAVILKVALARDFLNKPVKFIVEEAGKSPAQTVISWVNM